MQMQDLISLTLLQEAKEEVQQEKSTDKNEHEEQEWGQTDHL
jgi:hypothetical protein